MSRWELRKETREKYIPIITEFINKLELGESNDSLDLSNTELNPYTLGKLLEEIGYEEIDFDRNGWQMDFWITMVKEERKNLLISGTGITCEFRLSLKD